MTEKFLSEKLDIMINIKECLMDGTDCFRIKDKIYFPITAENGEEGCIVVSAKILSEEDEGDADLSGYSDKLWKFAYERGKADARREMEE